MRKKFLFAVMALLTMATGNVWGLDIPYVINNNFNLYFLCCESADLTEIILDGDTIKLTTANNIYKNCWKGTEVTNTGNGYPGWHSRYRQSTKVVIDKSFKKANITSCYGWFAGYKNNVAIDLSNLNTSNVTNMGRMFYDCSFLPSVTFGESFNTSKVTNMKEMFYGCNNMTSLDLSHFNTSNVPDMSYMFYGCSYLSSLDLSNFDVSNVTDMNNMFNGCTRLTSLTFGENFNSSNVTDMKMMFAGCSNLTSLDLNNLNTSKVTNMNHMFHFCQGLTSLDFSHFDTSNVTDMTSMFGYSENLTALDLSHFNTSKVTDMRLMFDTCRGLTSIIFGKNFNTSNVTTMAGMFSGCNSLYSLDLSTFDTSNVTDMGSMFSGCRSLTSITFGKNFDTSNVTGMGMRCTFSGCSSLTSLDLSHFNTSKVTDMYGMFYGCSSLTSLNLRNFDTSNVTNMERMFYKCSSLTSLDLSNFDTSKVSNMLIMFSYCSSLTSLDLSNFNTSRVTNMKEMFECCDNLTSLNLKNFDTSNANSYLYGIFNACPNLRLVDFSQATIPNLSEFEREVGNRVLTYVPAGTAVTEGRTNVVVGKECEHFVIDNNQLLLSIPYSFTANKITVNRNFTAENPHTLCLPFAVEAKAYGTFYAYEAYDDSSKGVTFNALEDATTTEANKPYLFMPTETLESGIVIDNPTWVAAYTAGTSADGEFIGVYKKKTFTQDEANEGVYYGWAGGEFKRAGEGASVDACRAYLKLPASSANRAPARLSVSLDGGATGISSAVNGADNGSDAPAYNLQGQRVGGSYKGVVIRNGKKVIMK